jgi:membrane-bound lytic murein transglycosylase D
MRILNNPSNKFQVKKRIRIVFFSTVTLLVLFVLFTIIQKERYFLLHKEYRHQSFNEKIPINNIFANETVHFKNEDAYAAFYEELKNNTQKNKSTTLLLKDAMIWLPTIENILIQYKIPTDFKYIAMVESNFKNVVSSKEAVGFWQLKESTAIELGLEINEEVDERLDPIKATHAACRFIKQAHREFGSWTITAAAYNRGVGGIQKALAAQHKTSYYDLDLNAETAKYLYKLLAAKDLVEHPSKYGLKLYNWKREPVRAIIVTATIDNLDVFARNNGTNLYVLKLYNPWLLKNSLTIKEEGTIYKIELPHIKVPAKKDSIPFA